jgi:hypothetical protein
MTDDVRVNEDFRHDVISARAGNSSKEEVRDASEFAVVGIPARVFTLTKVAKRTLGKKKWNLGIKYTRSTTGLLRNIT